MIQVYNTPEAIRAYELAALKAGLKLIRAGIKPNRNWSRKNVLLTVAKILGKAPYKQSPAGVEAAIQDIEEALKHYKQPQEEDGHDENA